MAKKEQNWDKAKALYEGFTPDEKGLRDIEKESGCPQSSIRARAKKDEWVRGRAAHLKLELVSVTENLAHESAHLRNVISSEAERILKAKGYIENVSLLGLKRLSQLIPEELKISEVKAGIEGAKTAMVTLGVVDYYPAQKGAVEPVGETGKKVTIVHAPAVKRVD
jgi:hypothetical protein